MIKISTQQPKLRAVHSNMEGFGGLWSEETVVEGDLGLNISGHRD